MTITRTMVKLEPHFLASFMACESACSVLEVLPDSDLIEDLRNLIYIQQDLFIHMIEGKHYGTNNINDFVEYTQEVKNQMARIRENQEWRSD